MPPSAVSISPRLSACASVKAPFSCPNSSDSSRSGGSAAQLTSTKRPAAPDRSWTSRASRLFPVPDSPVISRRESGESASRRAMRRTCSSRGSLPESASVPACSGGGPPAGGSAPADRSATARSISDSTSPASTGLRRKFAAPARIPSTAPSMLACAVMMRTGIAGSASLTRRTSSIPPIPGITRSESTASYGSRARRSIASSADPTASALTRPGRSRFAFTRRARSRSSSTTMTCSTPAAAGRRPSRRAERAGSWRGAGELRMDRTEPRGRSGAGPARCGRPGGVEEIGGIGASGRTRAGGREPTRPGAEASPQQHPARPQLAYRRREACHPHVQIVVLLAVMISRPSRAGESAGGSWQ